MFSGIVEEVGSVLALTSAADGQCLKISAPEARRTLTLGDSICVSGICLTVSGLGSDSFSAQATLETLRRTKLGALKCGDKVNLERALKVNAALGGHLVTGHVDGVGKLAFVKKEGFSKIFEFACKSDFAPLLVEKGSVSVDGVSLTVAYLKETKKVDAKGTLDEFMFAVALIPHTLAVTTLGQLEVGHAVNIETDLIGKYVARWLAPYAGKMINKAGITLPFLAEHGYT